jgi:hypothetical protein
MTASSLEAGSDSVERTTVATVALPHALRIGTTPAVLVK